MARKKWEIAGLGETPETAYLNRRQFLQKLGLASAGIGGLLATGAHLFADPPPPENPESAPQPHQPPADPNAGEAPPVMRFPYARNAQFTLDRAVTAEEKATTHNNFYEFSTDKDAVRRLVENFTIRPWTVEISGECEAPTTLDIDDLFRLMPVEERLYRFRCVEAWAMAVPWSGFALKTLLDRVKPLSSAKFVRFVSFMRPAEAPNQRNTDYYRWPYYEALRMDEAMHELTIVALGLYGKPMPKQNGAPVRLIVPWKYGYKSPKSIVKIELVRDQPRTFWNDLQPLEYGFYSNVDPAVPHPRWSQATERLIDTGTRVRTQKYNGYEDLVAPLYANDRNIR